MKAKYPKYLDKGYKKNRLTVIDVAESSKIKDRKKVMPSRWKYRCLCECMGIVYVTKIDLCTGHTRSCGCFHQDALHNTHVNNKKINYIEVNGNIIKIFFFNTDNYTIIDTEDYDKIKDYCWHEHRGYTTSSRTNGEIGEYRIHQLIMNIPKGMEADHINRNKLDNRKCNLRVCSHADNSKNRGIRICNTTGYTGIFFKKSSNRYHASIYSNGKSIFLGSFKNKQDAINVRHEAEIKYFGEFASCLCRGN